ncbi:MAG: hypothetical protein WBE26_02580 [Phycisphaerae bacterium]
MLLWVALTVPIEAPGTNPANGNGVTVRVRRLPFDRRCAALTKAGPRCRGRIRKEGEFCPFHDPELTAERRRRMAADGARKHRRLSHLPGGYLRKLTNRAAIGEAMDRLYREVRLGVITPEMGEVLFNILTRLLDSGLVDAGRCPQRTRAARLRPNLRELLTREERTAWQTAVANAADSSVRVDRKHEPAIPAEHALIPRPKEQRTVDKPLKLTMQAAS